jgi:hypothetical protein
MLWFSQYLFRFGFEKYPVHIPGSVILSDISCDFFQSNHTYFGIVPYFPTETEETRGNV